MDPELLTRMAAVLGILGAGILAYWLANRLVLARAALRADRLGEIQPGRPTLLYFTTPTCAPCKTVQRPAIQRLSEQLGDRLHVVEIDASANPEMAGQWGVLSVPTTFLLDSSGKPRHVNHGVAPAEKLFKQFNNIN